MRSLLAANRKRKGSVLVTTLIALMFISVIGMAILTLTLHGLQTTKRVKSGTIAFNLAESGLDRTLRWFKNQGSPPSNTSPFDPLGGTQTIPEGTYSVIVTPDALNAGATLKKYTIKATAVAGQETEVVELVIRQTSFGKYAYFTDRETSAISGGRIWFFSGDRLRGPVHSNNKSNSDFQINWGGPGPIFEGAVTSAGNAINYSPSNPTTEPQFTQIYLAGSRGYELNVDEIPLPSSSDNQKQAAWGNNGLYPIVNGVYTPFQGGIYIRGDSNIAMSVEAGTGNQIFTITQGATVTKLTVDKVNDRIARQVGAGPVTYSPGAGNGMVYSTGHINSLSGTIADNKVTGSPPTIDHRNSFTIATDVNAGKNIYVSGNLKHKTAYNPALGPNDPANLVSGTLGLIGRNVTVATGAPTNMEIDAVILAGSETTTDGSFGVQDYNSKQPTGTLKVLGGIIQKARGAVGTLSGGSLYTGYAKDYWYDARMADNPPPFFPTTGGYDRLSWRRLVD
jgi:hypothetical protein